MPVHCMVVSDAGDKSRAGGVDEPIRELVAFVNILPDVYTTSSCSGKYGWFCVVDAAQQPSAEHGHILMGSLRHFSCSWHSVRWHW